MTVRPDWVPMRWPNGPGGMGDNPTLLDILRGTPVNCLIISWADGRPEDAEQQKRLRPLIDQGRQLGLSFLGWVAAIADRGMAVNTAKAAGLAGLVAEQGQTTIGEEFPVLACQERAQIRDASAQLVLIRDNVWPGIQRGSAADAGPTAKAWINSNSWFLQLARARASDGTFWLLFDPPGKGNIVTTDDYTRAVADTQAQGGRWVLSLDPALCAGIKAGQAGAMKTWKAIAGTLETFKRHPGWSALRPLGAVGVISDFAGPNEFLSGEVLNLLARQNIPFRIIEASRAARTPFTGFKMLMCLDEAPPKLDLRNKLLQFVQGGGFLVAGRNWGTDGTAADRSHPHFALRTLGKGRIAISKDESPDPFIVCRDLHTLLGRKHDLLRFYNISALISHYSGAPDGTHDLLQIVSYAATHDVVTAWCNKRYSSARLWSPGSAEPVPLELLPQMGGVEVRLPAIATYAAVEAFS